MGTLLTPRSLQFRAGSRILRSPFVALDPLTDRVAFRIRRPTTAQGGLWEATTRMQTTLRILLDDEEYFCQGLASGGIRPHYAGGESAFYQLEYALPVLFHDRARMFLATAQPDAQGYYQNVPLTRLGELAKGRFQAQIIIEQIAGNNADLDLQLALSSEAPAPLIRHHNSIAFDAVTDAQEGGGDGVLSLSHTSSGADRAVFAAGGNSASTPQTSSSFTVPGASMTNRWDNFSGAGSYVRTAGWTGVGQSTGAQICTHTLAGSADEHVIAVISLTGVDQTTPVGTAATNQSNTTVTSLSATVGSVGSTDFLVDFLYEATASPTDPAVGADQTKRSSELLSPYVYGVTSTQLGTAGGVMSWTFATSQYGVAMGAIAFKEATGGGASGSLVIPPAFPRALLTR